ncbi:MAG: hypothetical protein IH595_00205 [Bacteroidales bacterium]|nr:hypothetical protein [Bacteroidales bacterium]
MKRIFIMLTFLLFPFWASAQWSAYITGGVGGAYETMSESLFLVPQYTYVDGYSSSAAYGYSFQGGLDIEYFISPRFGLATGLGYTFSHSPGATLNVTGGSLETKWHAEQAIEIPISLLWSPDRRHLSTISLGLSSNFSLMYNTLIVYGSGFLWYNNYFWGAHVGYSRQLGDRLRLGILLNRNLNWYMEEIAFQKITTDVGSGTLRARHYYTNLLVTVSYRLLGGRKEKK